MPRQGETTLTDLAIPKPTRSAAAHLVRFAVALVLLIGVSLAGLALEQRALQLGREHSLQTFRADVLQQQKVDLQRQVEELQTPARLKQSLPQTTTDRTGSVRGLPRVNVAERQP